VTLIRLALFALGSIPILVVSRHALRRPRSHGYYRTFAWEAILGLFLLNVEFWFVDPFAWHQLIAWFLLVLSLVLIVAGARQLKRLGRPGGERQDERLLGIEKTTRLVTTGLYRYIRHPFYASLLYLAWGIFFKNISWAGLALALIATGLLLATALIEERENTAFFGPAYREYMQRSKRFIPFIF
jgi:protein-S-isoprenylcysteine O-methyltransferase Ste14